jgi:hypothetical protein
VSRWARFGSGRGIFVGFGLLTFEDAFGPTFWISFSLHVAAAELWLRARPNPPELAQPATPALAVTDEAAL